MPPRKATELITEKRGQARNWLWKKRFETQYQPHSGMVGNGADLHFLFGLKGSGSEHLARILAKPEINLRCYLGILSRFEPVLDFGIKGDRLALECTKELPLAHPLLRVYRMLVEYDNDWVLEASNNRARPEQPETLPCLISETHALLASEAVLRILRPRAVLYIGDPLRIVDQVFDRYGMDCNYLQGEVRSIFSPYFLGRFYRRDYKLALDAYRSARKLKDPRQKKVAQTVLAVAMIQHMFRMLAARYPAQAIVLEYEDILENPYVVQHIAEHWFGEAGIEIGRTAVNASTFVPLTRDTAIWNETWPEKAGFPRFLKPSEVALCHNLLQDSGLEVPSQSSEAEDTVPILEGRSAS